MTTKYIQLKIGSLDMSHKCFEIKLAKPPDKDFPYWSIYFSDGSIIVTTEPVTIEMTIEEREV